MLNLRDLLYFPVVGFSIEVTHEEHRTLKCLQVAPDLADCHCPCLVTEGQVGVQHMYLHTNIY